MLTYFCRLQFNKMCHNSYITLDIKNPSRARKEGSMWNILIKFHSIWTIGSVANDEKVTVNLFKALTVGDRGLKELIFCVLKVFGTNL